MWRYIFILAISIMAVIFGDPLRTAHAEEQRIEVILDGERIIFPENPALIDGSVFVPMRTLFEKLGYSVEWFPKAQMITAKKDGKTLIMGIDSPNAYWNFDQVIPLPLPPRLIDGSTYVPLRFVGEVSGKHVKWDTASKTVIIQKVTAETLRETLIDTIKPDVYEEHGVLPYRSLALDFDTDRHLVTFTIELNDGRLKSSSSEELTQPFAQHISLAQKRLPETAMSLYSKASKWANEVHIRVVYENQLVQQYSVTGSDQLNEPEMFVVEADGVGQIALKYVDEEGRLQSLSPPTGVDLNAESKVASTVATHLKAIREGDASLYLNTISATSDQKAAKVNADYLHAHPIDVTLENLAFLYMTDRMAIVSVSEQYRIGSQPRKRETDYVLVRTTDGDWKMEGNDSPGSRISWDSEISKDGYEPGPFTKEDMNEVRKLLEARLSAMNAEDVGGYKATIDPASPYSGAMGSGVGSVRLFKETELQYQLFPEDLTFIGTKSTPINILINTDNVQLYYVMGHVLYSKKPSDTSHFRSQHLFILYALSKKNGRFYVWETLEYGVRYAGMYPLETAVRLMDPNFNPLKNPKP
ncbi:copper amine oxidase N-terminal domain-containing protein [Paenibacillus sp. SYP-B3998]|uniref:Copper amine oxidase N-terminal domain-containing protein n=1 Tax=Paenibacillus sp. SYP-B3998 TaxID=2678564 RepID=A0A6G4A0S6_9BACL|nr:copper amine oxidase N-terminal domain-containing protein [Paenibacillus sp. SYP-B3998]NEW07898.1 copper amine oxidase N-terminal domain-containing protein [Paenibacillus sp. SYP-B3998]